MEHALTQLNPGSTELLRWVILLPLFGAVINGLINRSKNVFIAGGIASTASIGAFLFALVAVMSRGQASSLVDAWFMWFKAGRIEVPFHLELTSLSSVMILIVTGIGSLIHIYSIGYMSHEESPWRFFAYLNLFLSAMLVLVLSASLVGVFMGWEGVGLCSYLLIGYWYKEDKNTAAGMKAFVTNRIGDLGFLVALFAIIAATGKTNVSDLVLLTQSSTTVVPTAIWLVFAGGLFWASTGKSAQFPLYVWLPDAMAGPTPVSALIHAATMVTSGIVVISRLWPIFAPLHQVLDIMLAVGIGTAYLAALIALTQRDIKKVMAYSTVSQLGFMFAALGAGSPTAAFFHVVTHACFKALLFLGSGSVIHGMHEKQDMFEMGGLREKMKITHITFLIATLAIIGFPLTAGFFSKDMILAEAYQRSPIAYFLLLGAAILTAFYMLRAYSLTFWGKPRSAEASHAHESGPLMWIPLAALATLSLFIGWVETPNALGGIHAFEHWVTGAWYGVVPAVHEVQPMSLGLEWGLMLITSAASLAVAYLSFKKYQAFNAAQPAPMPRGLVVASENKFYVDEAYNAVFIKPLKLVSRTLSKVIDSKVIDASLHGLRNTMQATGQVLSILHTGNMQTYAWYIAFATGLSILVSWVVIK